jgi:hypothetical protein
LKVASDYDNIAAANNKRACFLSKIENLFALVRNRDPGFSRPYTNAHVQLARIHQPRTCAESTLDMPKQTPKKTEEKIRTVVTAWEQIARNKKYGEMSLDEFKAIVAPSLNARILIDQLQHQLTQAINQRDDADDVSLAKIQLVVNGVLADPTEDGSLYEAMGYIRKSERKSGLTTKKKTTPKP